MSTNTNTVLIDLDHNLKAIIDEEDYELVTLFSKDWRYVSSKSHSGRITYYAKSRNVLMHRLILNTPPRTPTDHRDHNGLNNSRSNISITTNALNGRNAYRPVPKSGFHGVSQSPTKNSTQKPTFRSQIRHNGVKYNLGNFDTAIEAAIAYDIAAYSLFGDLAVVNMNFPSLISLYTFPKLDMTPFKPWFRLLPTRHAS